MSDEPADYGRTKTLAYSAHWTAARAYMRLDLIERAFAALPGAADVDVERLAEAALQDYLIDHPSDDGDEVRERIGQSVARMRGTR
jgi:hypothetical protein